MDAKEQELIDVRDKADRKLDEAYHKWVEASLELREYRKSKA